MKRLVQVTCHCPEIVDSGTEDQSTLLFFDVKTVLLFW